MDNSFLQLDRLLIHDPILTYDPYYGWLHSFLEPLSDILETNYEALHMHEASQAMSMHIQFLDNFTKVLVCILCPPLLL